MILSLETTEKFGSVALLDGTEVLSEIELPKNCRSSRTLNPAIEELLRQTNTTPDRITVVAVVTGPGSFTGLRVGVTAAKLFAYAVQAKIVGICTFEAVAKKTDGLYSIGVDAQRNEVIVSVNSELPKLLPVTDWWKQREQYPDIIFSGPALERYGADAPPDAVLASEEDRLPKASLAALAAYNRIAKQQFDDVRTLVPVYSRLSAAEERRTTVLPLPVVE